MRTMAELSEFCSIKVSLKIVLEIAGTEWLCDLAELHSAISHCEEIFREGEEKKLGKWL